MRFFIEITLPDDCETISYTTDELEKCAAVATEFDGCSPLARLAGNDCSVYTVKSLLLQLRDERLVGLTVLGLDAVQEDQSPVLNTCNVCGTSIEGWATRCEKCGGEA